MLKDLKVAHKLFLGFGAMIILTLLAILAGYRGIGSLDSALRTIADKQAPLVDTANRMNTALLKGRNAMETFKSTTSSLFEPDSTAIEASKTAFNDSVASFDRLADAILSGAVLENGYEIIATDNPALIQQIQAAKQLHSGKLQVAANTLFTAGSELVSARKQVDVVMIEMTNVVEGVISTSDQLGKAATLELNKWKLSERGVQKLLDTGLTLIAQIKEMKVAIQQSRLALEKVAQSETVADVNTAASDYEKSVEAFGPIIDNMQRAFSSRSVSSSLRRLRNLHKQMKESGEVLINAQLQLLSQAEQAQQAMTQLDNEGNQATKLINQVVALAIEDMERAKQESQSASSQAGTLVIIVGLVAIASSLLLGTLITRSITLPLGGEPAEMRRIARTIADGDLTLTFDQQASDDCVYGAMREMSANLRAMIGNIVNSSSLLAATAEQSSVTTEHTLNVIQEQHAKTDLVATAINEMSATVQDIAINTSEVASATDEAKRQGDEGLRTLTGATHAINQLVDQVSSASQAMTQMHDKSLEIGQVLEVIQGIAEQTNLLALNAAIEAARAGEQGRGFAVVADEVRTLAQRTQASASDIQTMIEAVQSAAGSATKTMQLSQAQAIQTSEHATHTSDAFNGIKDAVEKIRGMTLQVAAASEQQSHVAEEVKRNIAHIRELALQTSSSAEQLAGANNEVASSAETLNSIAVQFKV